MTTKGSGRQLKLQKPDNTGGMTFAYADPPYIGMAKKHYSDDPDCAEVDHNLLLAQLRQYDGWALSCSVPTLQTIMEYPNFPCSYRLGAWVKPFASFKPGVNPAYAWEPVIFWGGRKRGRDLPTIRDWVSANITLKRGLAGAKPEKFCFWVFEFLGMQSDDKLVDLFPGTGAVTRAFEKWKLRLPI